MDTQNNQTENVPTPSPASSSCWKRVKDESTTIFANVKGQISEIAHTPMAEHKACITQKMSKMYEGMSKKVANLKKVR